jgi:hypothetical protein
MRNIDANAVLGQFIVEFANVTHPATAIPGDQRRAALREIARRTARAFIENRVVAVVVQVNEARANHHALTIDRAVGGNLGGIANDDDFPIAHGNAADKRFAARTVDDPAACQ